MSCFEILKKLPYDNVSSSFNIALKMLDCSIELFDAYDIKPIIEEIIKMQSSMAVVLNIGSRILKATGRSQLEELKEDLLAAEKDACSYAKEVLGGFKSIATISYSNTVLCVIGRVKPDRVFVSVGHPAREGEALAKGLLRYNINVTLFEDTGYSLIAKDVDAFVIGADAIFDDYVVNKLGSFYLALLAREYKKPLYVVANKYKYLDKDLRGFYRIKEMPEGEVSSVGCEVINVYFEKIPGSLVTEVIGV